MVKEKIAKVLYKTKQEIFITECSIRKDSTMIGSMTCGECKNYLGIHKRKHYVLCKNKE